MESVPHSEKTYIYALVDPESNLIRYVGKSNDPDDRLKRHFEEKHFTYKNHWLQSLKKLGLKPTILILEHVDVEHWQARERFWIQHYRSLGLPLTNGTDGGDGVHGMRHSPEARHKIGLAAIGNQYGKGYKLTPEQKARKRAALLGHTVSSGTAEKIAASKRGKSPSQETRAKIAATLRGRPISESARQKRVGKKQSPESNAKRSEAIKRYYALHPRKPNNDNASADSHPSA